METENAYEVHTKCVEGFDWVWLAIGSHKGANPFMIIWNWRLSICDVVLQIKEYIRCMYKFLDI